MTPRVKPWMIQRLLTFDSIERILKCDSDLCLFMFISQFSHSWYMKGDGFEQGTVYN